MSRSVSARKGPAGLSRFTPWRDASRARLVIRADVRSPHRITPFLTGKFCEHLGSNIYNGMEAQILRNPTFGDFPFGGGGTPPDGGASFQCDAEKITAAIMSGAKRLGAGARYGRELAEARADGLAFGWIREGARAAVRVSPDAGAHRGGRAGRAQRIEAGAGRGVSQLVWLPLHRVRAYEWRIVARSDSLKDLEVELSCEKRPRIRASARVEGLSRGWRTFRGRLVLPRSAPADGLYRFSIKAAGRGQFVIARALLYPADHADYADPDVIRMLRESGLPLLRWPGGNFVSGYDWTDGVGPVDSRPTRPNPAWSGLESNLFGTDEFVAFCRKVGCEPMICVNAGDGTPQEAARWVEYCNGSAATPMGRLRARNGHARPFNIRCWEIGNELTGRHQIGWTTPAGYADRYREFAEAMLAADPSIRLIACGAPPWWKEPWNELLIARNRGILRSITDHILVGGRTDPSVDPLDVLVDFMGFADYYERRFARLRDRMARAGIKDARLAVTELQLFAGIAPAKGRARRPRLTPETLVNPATMAEALYDASVYHGAVRLAPFVEMVTHSATVNHGGGLRKERERVYANPCHHAQSMLSTLNGARPVAVELAAGTQRLQRKLRDNNRFKVDVRETRVVDAVAAVSREGDLIVSGINRAKSGPVALEIEMSGADFGPSAEVTTLSADVPWARNTLSQPDAVRLVRSRVKVQSNRLRLELPPYSVTLVRVGTAGKGGQK